MSRNPLLMWLCAVAFYVYTYVMRSSVTNVLNSELIEYFHSDAIGIANLVGCYYIPYALMPIPVGILFDRYGVRKIAITASAFCVLGFLLFFLTDRYFVAMCGQMILGIASSFAFILMLKVATTWFPADRIALLSSIGCSIGLMGPMIANPTLASLSQHYPWRMVLFAFAGIGIVLCLAMALCMHDGDRSDLSNHAACRDTHSDHITYSECHDHAEHSDHPALSANDMHPISLRRIFSLLCRRDLLLIGIYSMCIYASVIVFCDVWGITFLSEMYGYSTLEASCELMYVYFGSIIGAPLCAFFSQRFSYARILLVGAIGVATLLLCVNFLHLSRVFLLMVLFVFGIFLSFQVLVFSFAISICPKDVSASVSGIINMLTSFAGMFLEPIFGLFLQNTPAISDVQHNWDAGFLVLLFAALIALFIALVFTTERQLENARA